MKKLKGHTVIELKDIVTGEVEKIESDNLVTNAVQEFLSLWQPLLGWGAIAEYFTPLYRKFFSGLYLFDTAQVESASNTFLPNAATAKLTGYAGGAATDGNDTKRGSFNFTESEELLNGYKFVWDFGTSEANGTIASLSLTHPIAGYHGYHYHPSMALYNANSYTGNTPGNYKGMGWSGNSNTDGINHISSYSIGLYDSGNTLSGDNSAYSLSVQPERINVKSCHAMSNVTRLFEALIKTNNLNLVDLYGKKEFNRQNVSNTDQPYQIGLSFDTGSEVIIVWNSSSVLYVNSYDKTTFALTDSYNINIYTETGKYMRYIRGNGGCGAAYRNGYLYLIAYDNGDLETQGYVLRFNVSTKEALIITPKFTITQSPNSSTTSTRYSHALVYKDVNGNVYAGGYVIDNSDNYIENDLANPGTGSGDYNFYLADNYGYLSMNGDYSMNLIPNLQYLATINNLASPVIKTASKVMKITYTLTEAT